MATRKNKMSIRIRNYDEQDLNLIVILLNAAEAADHAEEGTSIQELRAEYDFPDFKPKQNAFVAEDDGGRIVGVAGIRLAREPHEVGFRVRFNVHPMQRGRGLEDRLLARLYARAQERLRDLGDAKVYFSGGGHEFYPERLRAMERAEMTEVRRFWVMKQPLRDEFPTPRFPLNLVIRNYRLGDDDDAARDALNAAFRDHFGYTDETLETWSHYLRLPTYRPDLTVLAVESKSGKIVGFCHIVVNEAECQRLGKRRGWIDMLGVRREYRQRGLGEALLLQGLHNLRAAGMEEATLGCDSENTTGATRLYFRNGFAVAKTWITFSKNIRQPKTEQESELEMVTL
jgi:mycothiol synthase